MAVLVVEPILAVTSIMAMVSVLAEASDLLVASILVATSVLVAGSVFVPVTVLVAGSDLVPSPSDVSCRTALAYVPEHIQPGQATGLASTSSKPSVTKAKTQHFLLPSKQ